jgi:hypothetical protein
VLATRASAAEVRQKDLLVGSHQHPLDIPATVEEHADISTDLYRPFAQTAGQFRTNDLPGTNPPIVEVLQQMELAWFKALRVTKRIFYGDFSYGKKIEYLYKGPYYILKKYRDAKVVNWVVYVV